VGIPRIMFLYHYFPILPFVMLIIVSFIKAITGTIKSNAIIYIYIAIVICAFEYFYPIYSGIPISKEYVEGTKWLETWRS
jgi:dolichyl-phosphate-mannose--protein O-mannosyl transferase